MQRPTPTRRALLAVTVLPVALLAAACGSDSANGFADDGSVPAVTVVGQLTSFLSDQGITGATNITCADMKDAVGEKQTCTVDVDGKTYDVPVDISASDDKTTTFEFDPSAIPTP